MSLPRRYLLDTSVYSQPLRPKPIETALERWQEYGDAACAISRVTVAEIEWGLHKKGSERLWAGYRRDMEGTVAVLETDELVWDRFARMKAAQHALGRLVSDLDLLIGATAVYHSLIVATLNIRHFALIEGLHIEDWSQMDA
ncbi:type II toxin-antitoxin system VapC family toxin [soil metagenome]